MDRHPTHNLSLMLNWHNISNTHFPLEQFDLDYNLLIVYVEDEEIFDVHDILDNLVFETEADTKKIQSIKTPN